MIAKLGAQACIPCLMVKIHIILRSLWEDDTDYSRAILLSIIDVLLPLSYGVWKALNIFLKS